MTHESDRRSPAPTTIDRIIDELAVDPRFVHRHHQPARDADPGTLERPLPEALERVLPGAGLWSHQARAIDLIRSGVSTVITTGTASGKSLCYQIPIAESALGGATALCIHPTKALAMDQLMSMARLNLNGLVPATYDGDCSRDERSWARANANVLFTNPEMLHNSILPGGQRWSRFLRSISIVVIDEMHAFRGVFGSNMAHVLRRLRRAIRQHGGTDPVFVFTSATIGEPQRLAGELIGTDVAVVEVDGSPRGGRDILVWNPHRSANGLPLAMGTETAMMSARLIRAGLRTLTFTSSRRSTEVVAEAIRSSVERPESVRSYRGGYLREERREIEQKLFDGSLRGVVTTTALELGVDIGGLDAVVMGGYPGTIASFRQQLGRAGRSSEPSLAILIAGENQLDQWVCDNPNELFDRPPEPAAISLCNPLIYAPHLGCAAFEQPLTSADSEFWPDQLDEGVRQLVLSDRARIARSAGGSTVTWIGRGSPAPTINLRSTGGGEFRIVDTTVNGATRFDVPAVTSSLIGTVPEASLYTATHLGAIYLHQGSAWRVVGIDRATRVVFVEPDPGDTYTLARSSKQVSILSITESVEHDGWGLHIGDVQVSTRVTGYQVRSASTHQVLGRERLDVPDAVLRTRAVWYSFDPAMIDRAGIDPADVQGTLHAAEHGAIGMLPLFAICDRWDVGGLSTEWLADTAAPTIVIHDSYPGGAGMAELAFAAAGEHLTATLDVLLACPCEGGCPRCVQSPKCGNGNEPLDKAGAARLLSVMVGADPHAVPMDEFVGF